MLDSDDSKPYEIVICPAVIDLENHKIYGLIHKM